MEKGNNHEGFTLLEVIIAIFLLVVGILGVASMQMGSIEGNVRAVTLTDASTMAGDRMELLMGRSYDDDDLKDSSNTGANAGETGLGNTDEAGKLADGGPIIDGQYTVYWNVAENFPVFGTKTIRVVITWDSKGVPKTISKDFIKMRHI